MTTKHISHSELDSARQCRLKHHLAYRELWGLDGASEALDRGSLFHAVMEAHYTGLKRALDQDMTVDEGAGAWYGDPPEGELPTGKVIDELLWDAEHGTQSERQEKVEWMFTGYRDHYGTDKLWEILDVEFKVASWLPTEKGTRSTFKLHGTVDLLVRDHSAGGGLWIVDHKTCKNLPKERDLDLDDQMALYTYLLKRDGLDLRGAIYNAVRHEQLKTRVMVPKERFLRRLTVRTDQELENIALEVLDQMRDVYRPQEHRDLPPRSPDPDRCGWRCPFTEPCLMSRKGQPIRPLLENMSYVQKPPRYGPGSEGDE